MSAFNNGNFADSKRVKTDIPEEEQPSLIINQVNFMRSLDRSVKNLVFLLK
jgi:hypothetical protein